MRASSRSIVFPIFKIGDWNQTVAATEKGDTIGERRKSAMQLNGNAG
jgi:hypothetical protein